ncbi:MAG TPA: TonB-dependent receptor, partial [Gammaproteobacteria bacterium]|nr:TonB-dependent receptor [Gammaproteobacteria bacterium]
MRFGKFLCFVIILAPVQAHAEQCANWVARMVSLQGSAEIRVIKTGQPASWQPVANNVSFCREDVVRISKNSRMTLALSNDTILRLDQNTTVTFSNIAPDAPSTLNLLEGVAHFISRVKRAFRVITPFVDAGIEGTEFVVAVQPGYAEVTVFEGQVAVSNERGKLMLGNGQTAIAEQGQAPVLKIRLKPRNAVHWALHYPAILQADEQLLAGLDPDVAQKTISSIAQIKADGPSAALESVAQLSGNTLTAPLLSYRAALYLTVGRAGQATQDLEKALSLSPRYSNALALTAIIALVQDRVQQASSLASEAVAADPASAAAGLALSYSQQARFDINAAYQTINRLAISNPQNDILLSRQAELALMLGNTQQAVAIASRATAINPMQARAHTVLGFAYLARNKPALAKKAFAQAMTLDAADPQVRLGIGLVNIRQENLATGRRELEIAASLDPNNALIRSYLGKAYQSEHRNKVANSQYDMARTLDPNDPTPWLYSAISKQANNRPVEAMLDLQQSAQLNDNRAVYRSRFLLDQDQATRASDLGNVYRELGFERQALLQGWTSTEQNPLDHSAHKLLADTYSAAPRHEQARINEQFLFTMLKPVDNTPIRPELAEAGLGILEGTGPSSAGFGDYNTLFDTDRDNVEISGSAGDNKTHSTQLLGWGKHKNVGYSTSLYRYATNGFRENNDQEIKIFSQFVQAELNDQAAIQFEYKRLDIDRGDLDLRATGLFTPSLRQTEKIDTYRVGYRHKLKQNSVILASLMYQDGDLGTSFDALFPVPPFPFPLPGKISLTADTSNIVAELRHIQTHNSYNATTGFGIRHLDGDETIMTNIPLLGISDTTRLNT